MRVQKTRAWICADHERGRRTTRGPAIDIAVDLVIDPRGRTAPDEAGDGWQLPGRPDRDLGVAVERDVRDAVGKPDQRRDEVVGPGPPRRRIGNVELFRKRPDVLRGPLRDTDAENPRTGLEHGLAPCIAKHDEDAVNV